MQGIGYPRDGKSERARRMVRKAETSNSREFRPPLGWRARRQGHVTTAHGWGLPVGARTMAGTRDKEKMQSSLGLLPEPIMEEKKYHDLLLCPPICHESRQQKQSDGKSWGLQLAGAIP